MEDELMTPEEVAKYLKLKPQTIYNRAQKRKIPGARIGKEWRFRRSMIDKWFDQHIDDKFNDLMDRGEEQQ